MKTLILLAGAALLGATAPAAAKPDNGHGSGNSNHATMAHGHSGQVKTVHGKSDAGIIRTDHGRLYALGTHGCPPGLAKKNNGCLPPGQAKKLYNVGHRFPQHYGNLWNYDQVPYDLRQQYGFGANDRYYYGDGYIYQVDPKSMLIQQVVSAILR